MSNKKHKPIFPKKELNDYLKDEKFIKLIGAYIQSAVISGDWHVGFELMPKPVQTWLKEIGIDPYTLNYKDLSFSYRMGSKWETETARKIASVIPYPEDWHEQINEIAFIVEQKI